LIAPALANVSISESKTPVRSDGQAGPRPLKEIRESASGVTFLIGINERIVYSPASLRLISVFLEAQSFTIENLKKVFAFLSERYPAEEDVTVEVSSVKHEFREGLRQYGAVFGIPWDEKTKISDSLPSRQELGLHATYYRTPTSERFIYY